MSKSLYASDLLEKLGIPNTPAAKAARKAAEEVESASQKPPPLEVNNNTRRKKIQRIKNAVTRQIARAKLLDAIEKDAEKKRRAEEIYNEWIRRAKLRLSRPTNASSSVRSSKNSKSKSKSPKKTRRNRS
jgi:hypothetical protein